MYLYVYMKYYEVIYNTCTYTRETLSEPMISLSTWHFFPSSAAARVACTGLCRCDGAQRQQSQEGQHGDGWAPMAEDESNSMESAGIHMKNRCVFF